MAPEGDDFHPRPWLAGLIPGHGTNGVSDGTCDDLLTFTWDCLKSVELLQLGLEAELWHQKRESVSCTEVTVAQLHLTPDWDAPRSNFLMLSSLNCSLELRTAVGSDFCFPSFTSCVWQWWWLCLLDTEQVRGVWDYPWPPAGAAIVIIHIIAFKKWRKLSKLFIGCIHAEMLMLEELSSVCQSSLATSSWHWSLRHLIVVSVVKMPSEFPAHWLTGQTLLAHTSVQVCGNKIDWLKTRASEHHPVGYYCSHTAVTGSTNWW